MVSESFSFQRFALMCTMVALTCQDMLPPLQLAVVEQTPCLAFLLKQTMFMTLKDIKKGIFQNMEPFKTDLWTFSTTI